ncbi:hypothetical protein EJB05_24133, partial [Eragrostis curvula]
MYSVLGNDDLLREILLSLGLPTSLLRAALVCRRWYRLVSDPAFLRDFSDRHPPRILGAYLNTDGRSHPRFFPVRPLPELAAAARRAGSFFDGFEGSSAFIHDSRGSRLLVTSFEDHYSQADTTDLVCSPLSAVGNAVIVPPPPSAPQVQLIIPQEYIIYHYCEFLPVNGGGDGRSYFCVLIGFTRQETIVHLCELQDMWVVRASSVAQLPVTLPPRMKVMLFDDSKFYILVTINKILVCDFPSSSISTMDVPDGVENDDASCSIRLSRGGGSGLFLIHVKESLLRVFKTDNGGNWFLVHSICLHEVCSNLGMADWLSLNGHTHGVEIYAVGDNAKFVFLDLFGTIVFLDITSKQAEKVYEMTQEGEALVDIHALMLTWPPIFPQLKEGYNQ